MDAFQAGLEEDVASEQAFETLVVGSTAVSITGLAVGYVFWLIQGGSLLAGVASALPVWCWFDPLPVLDTFDQCDECDHEDDSLESMVAASNRKHQPREESGQESRETFW
jgi:hypothetical protein